MKKEFNAKAILRQVEPQDRSVRLFGKLNTVPNRAKKQDAALKRTQREQ